MTFVTGSATSHLDLQKQLIEIATGQHAASLDSIAAGGTGYVAGEIITLTGGTFTHPAKVEVLTHSGGVILTAQIAEGGAYTTPPSDPVGQGSTTGSGTGATFNLTFDDTGWTVLRRSQEAVSATVAAAGTGYNVGDDLTLLTEDAVGVTTAAVFNVDTLTGGPGTGVATVSLLTAGLYEQVQSSPTDIGTSVAPAGGTGALLNVTFQDADTQEGVVILEGEGDGSDSILVGVRAYNVAAQSGAGTCRNWALAAFTGYNPLLTYDLQPGVSPGAGVSATTGAYVPLHDNGGSFPILFWVSATNRRLVGVALVENATIDHYVHWHLGFLNPFGTETEFPYPIYVAGSTSRHNTHFSDTTSGRISGLTEAIRVSIATGPGFYRTADSVWQAVRNSNVTDTGTPSRAASSEFTVYPCGQTSNLVPIEDDIVRTSLDSLDWQPNVIPATGVPGSPVNQMKATPDTGGDLHVLIPATLCASFTGFIEPLGEIDGVFWTPAWEGESNQDRILIGTERYLIFQNGNRVEGFSFMALQQS